MQSHNLFVRLWRNIPYTLRGKKKEVYISFNLDLEEIKDRYPLPLVSLSSSTFVFIFMFWSHFLLSHISLSQNTIFIDESSIGVRTL